MRPKPLMATLTDMTLLGSGSFRETVRPRDARAIRVSPPADCGETRMTCVTPRVGSPPMPAAGEPL